VKLSEYAKYDGLGLADLVKNREVTSKELALLAVQGIEKINPQINAVIETYADRIDDLDESSLGNGPFRGVPFIIKDFGAYEKGRKRESGSRLCEGYICEEDTYLMRLFKASGVNNLGRSNVPEFCISSSTENVLYGNTSTPWRTGYSAGGSSGGAAAAVAAGIVPIAHGSDIGGSMRIPASWCGCVGMKPSRGRVSTGPLFDEGGYGMSQNLVQTRTVRDLAAMLDCVGIPQPGDPFVIKQPQRPYLQEIGGKARPLRIAYSAASLTGAPVDPEVSLAIEKTARVLSEMGHDVIEAAPNYNAEAIMEAFLDTWFFQYYKMFDDLSQRMGRAIDLNSLEPITLVTYHASKNADPATFTKALGYFNQFRRELGNFWRQYDIWLSPTTAQVAEPHGRYNQSRQDIELKEWMNLLEDPVQFCLLYNISGCPAISLPLAQHSQGLPIGVQLGAAYGEESVLFQLASALELAMPWQDRVPPIHVGADKLFTL